MLDEYSTDKEKIEMQKVEAFDDRINVPAHLAINQCVISTIKDQFKIVNKCMLHMMFRQQNLLNHLKALRVVFLSGQGDIVEQFASQLFHDNYECTLKQNSVFFLNNCFDLATKYVEKKTDDLFFNTNSYLNLFSFSLEKEDR